MEIAYNLNCATICCNLVAIFDSAWAEVGHIFHLGPHLFRTGAHFVDRCVIFFTDTEK